MTTPYDWPFEEPGKYSVGMLQRFDGQRAAYREGYQKRAEEDDARYQKLVEAAEAAKIIMLDVQSRHIRHKGWHNNLVASDLGGGIKLLDQALADIASSGFGAKYCD